MIAFTKMQAVGNDFVVIEEPEGTDLSELAVRACDRRFGIGADGLLTYRPVPNPSPQPPSLSQGRGSQAGSDGLVFRIFNSDGSEDTMCGNGLRCVVQLAVERGEVPSRGVAQTHSGNVPYSLEKGIVTLTLPPPRFWEESVAQATTVDTGSLHTVLWPAHLPDDAIFFAESPRIESASLFPEKTSVMWAVADLDNQLRIRIWERGVGETLGCGTGACAAAVVAIREGRARSAHPLAITSRGGTLTVVWDGGDSSPIFLTGPAQTVFSGTL